jgi:hypothetical protein
MPKRKHHNAGWGPITNSTRVKSRNGLSLNLEYGEIKVSVDSVVIQTLQSCPLNCLEEMGDLSLQLAKAFREGFSSEKKVPGFAKIDMEARPSGTVCLEPCDGELMPENIVSLPDEIGNIPLIKERDQPFYLQSDLLATLFTNIAHQAFELGNAVMMGRRPTIFMDLETYWDPEMINVKPRAKYEQIAMKNALYLSEKAAHFDDLFQLYKVALHEINVLTKTIQDIQSRVRRHDSSTTLKVRSGNRDRSRNANPKTNDLLSQFFLFCKNRPSEKDFRKGQKSYRKEKGK